MPHSEGNRPYIWLCLLVLAGALPFLSRAVYTDEPQYLHVAHYAAERDWHFPQDVSWTFFGKTYPNLASQTHLPVVEYYLALLLRLFGRFDLVKFRLMFVVFPMLAIVSFHRIARHFTSNPLLVSCLLAVSPAFLVLSPALMMDIPMLAFLLTGLAIHLDALETGARLWLSSVCFVLALGTAYTAAIPIGCLLVWSAWHRRPWRERLAIAVAPAAILIWLLILRIHLGQSPTAVLVGYYTSDLSVRPLILPLIGFIGGVSALPWIFSIVVERFRFARYILASVSVAFALTLFSSWPSTGYRLWFVLLASSGVGMLILWAVKVMERDRGNRPLAYGFLMLWFPAMLLFLLLFAKMISARYILLAMPPLFLVVFDRVQPAKARIAIVATAALSIMLAIADYRHVNSYPQWVSRHIVPLQRQGFRVWNAAESGLRFYAQEQGIETLSDSDVRPKGGDLIVRQESFSYGLSEDLEPLLMTVYKTTLFDPYPLRTFSRAAGAGFHDSHFGVVPYSISRVPLDEVQLMEVSPFVTGLPEHVPEDFSSVPVWFPGGVLLKQTQTEMNFPLTIPRGSTVKFDVEGEGSVVVSEEGIRLSKRTRETVIWKNFQIIPNTWP